MDILVRSGLPGWISGIAGLSSGWSRSRSWAGKFVQRLGPLRLGLVEEMSSQRSGLRMRSAAVEVWRNGIPWCGEMV